MLFPALRDLFKSAARTGIHCVFSAAILRGCRGGPDDAICQSAHFARPMPPLSERQAHAVATAEDASGFVRVSLQALNGYYLRAKNGTVGRIDPGKMDVLGSFLSEAILLKDGDDATVGEQAGFFTYCTNDFPGAEP